MNQDTAIILALVIILLQEGGDMGLLLALLYILS